MAATGCSSGLSAAGPGHPPGGPPPPPPRGPGAPQAPPAEEALSLLAKSCDAMGVTQLPDDADLVMRTNFPDSVYFGGGPEDARPWWQLW